MSDRRYIQRGYRDDDRDRERRERKQQQLPPKKEGPRGRGLGAPTSTLFRCADCGRRVAVAAGVELDGVCPGCGADLHACVSCIHFDPSARFQCRQEIAQPVPKKRKRNDCTLFEPKLVVEFESDTGAKSPDEARAAFDDLFGNL